MYLMTLKLPIRITALAFFVYQLYLDVTVFVLRQFLVALFRTIQDYVIQVASKLQHSQRILMSCLGNFTHNS